MLRKPITCLIFFILVQMASGQNTTNDLANRINIVTTAVPFLSIQLNPAINGFITTIPDGTCGPGIYGNNALLALDSSRFQASADVVPWIRQLYPDWNLFGFGASYRLTDRHTIGINLCYFSLGTQTVNTTLQVIHPSEFAGTIYYTYNLDKFTGIGVGFRYISSNLTDGYYVGGIESHPGTAVAVDLGFAKQLPGRNGKMDHFFGVMLKNVGSKISYTHNSDKEFIPITLKAGYGIRLNISGRQSLTLSYEFAKLLVPSPPVYYADSVDGNNDPIIQAGYDPNVGVIRGMVQSIYDAPGGIQEEFHEINHSFGMVYNYRFLSAGAGYHYQNETKGNNKFFTIGLSGNFKLNHAGTSLCRLNVSYLLPTYKNSPMKNTVQVGMSLVI